MLLTFLIESLLRDQVVSFVLTVAMVLAIMILAYRSLKIGLVSLVPNVFPILLVLGAMGWIGVPINVGTAMIAAVSMGLTIDASIFYLYGYRRSREAGLSLDEALRQRTRDSAVRWSSARWRWWWGFPCSVYPGSFRWCISAYW